MEYIYLLETRESVRLGDQIYKIGKTKQEIFKRFDQYPTGTILILYRLCFNCDKVEKSLLKIFNTKYKNISIYGTEYFHGDLTDMCNDINNYINQEYHEVTKKSKNANIVNNLKTVNNFDELVKQQGKETIAETKMTLTNSTNELVAINKNSTNNINNDDGELETISENIENSENSNINNGVSELETISENSNDKENIITHIEKPVNIIDDNTIDKTKPDFICANCDKVYKSRVGLWKHNKICVPKVEEKKYICSFCNKNFSCRQSRWTHEKTCKAKKEQVTASESATINELKNEIKILKSQPTIQNNIIHDNRIINNYTQNSKLSNKIKSNEIEV